MLFRHLCSVSMACAFGVLLAAPAWAFDPPPATSRHTQQSQRQVQPRWRNMTPQQRADVREGVRRFQHMDPQQRQRVRKAFHEYQELPPAQRRELRKQWRQQHDSRKPAPRDRQSVPRQPVPALDDDDPRR